MSIIDEKTRRFAANGLFPTFFFATLGLILAQAWAIQMHGSWGLHFFVGIPGCALAGLALFRARLHWRPASDDCPARGFRGAGWYLLLFGVGVFTGMLVSAGSVVLLGTIASLSYFLPWWKIPACRSQFAASALVTLAGAVTWVTAFGKPVHPLHYVVDAWVLFLPSMFMQFLVLASLDRDYRIDECAMSGKPHDLRVPLPQ